MLSRIFCKLNGKERAYLHVASAAISPIIISLRTDGVKREYKMWLEFYKNIIILGKNTYGYLLNGSGI